jgi:hypothetical protein
MDEANRVLLMFRKQRERAIGSAEAFGPDSQAIGLKITIKVMVGIRAAVVATPTVRMKLRDVWCVCGFGQPYLNI